MSTAAERNMARLRVAEAIGWLLAARLLIAAVPMRLWRGSLGQVAAGDQSAGEALHPLTPKIARAVIRGCEFLPIAMVCLPRAMAAQWMLGRRGVHSALVFGILPGGQRDTIDALHAWVEAGGEIVIGDSGEDGYRRGLVLIQ